MSIRHAAEEIIGYFHIQLHFILVYLRQQLYKWLLFNKNEAGNTSRKEYKGICTFLFSLL
jgi:hypothetical protein